MVDELTAQPPVDLSVDTHTESPVRECTWTECHEPATDRSGYYCSKHAESVTPGRLQAMIARMQARPRDHARAHTEAIYTAIRASLSRKAAGRRIEKQSRAKGRPHKPKRDHGRKKG